MTQLQCRICGKPLGEVLSWTSCPWFGGYICADHCFEDEGCVYLQNGSSNVKCTYRQRRRNSTPK